MLKADTRFAAQRGYIVIENPADLGLEPGVPNQSVGERFALSAFHQMHCLVST